MVWCTPFLKKGCLFKVNGGKSPRPIEEEPGLYVPTLEGIASEGRLAVIYSRYGLGASWEEVERPYARAYDCRSALRVGMNAVVYALIH